MIEFRWNRVDKRNNNTPIISDAEIDELAEIILGDYKPQLLQEPRKVKLAICIIATSPILIGTLTASGCWISNSC